MAKKTNVVDFKKNLQTSFSENFETSKLKLALLKENFEYRDFFIEFLKSDKKHREDNDGIWPVKDFKRFGLVGLRFFMGDSTWKYDEMIDLINPQKDVRTLSDKSIANILPQLFYDHAIEQIEIGKLSHIEGGYHRSIGIVNQEGLKPWERLYKVDLRKKKTQIIKEFKGYLDRTYLINPEILTWFPNNKRERKETWVHLKVWQLRRERKTFLEISKALKITQEVAKKSFYRAYELTQRRKYYPEAFRKEIWYVKKTGIKQTCDTCPLRDGCKELCPDVLRYVNQDETPLREKILSNGSDSLRDNLTQKNLDSL